MPRAAQKVSAADKRPPAKAKAPVAVVPPPGKNAKRGAAGRAQAPQRGELSAEELRKALEAAERRIAELEATQAQIADRLAWVLDTLETMLAEDG
ncbi:MAG: hypothetical protein RL291_528 [Pseudomonadota bacterium]